MSSVSIGPPIVIDGPLPLAPGRGLLAAAQIVGPDGSERWLDGAAVHSYPDDMPEAFNPMSEGTLREKAEGTVPPLPIFGAFTLVLPITCTAKGVTDDESFRQRALRVHAAVESFGLEAEFVSGAANPLNPYMEDANVNLLAGGPFSPAEGLALLENSIGATGRGGVIHADPATATALGDEVEFDGTMLRTVVMGTPFAAGGGYIGSVPTGGGALAAGQSYMYATGPVQIRRSEVEVIPGSLAEALDRSLNVITYRAERHYLVVWDTVLQDAVLIDRTP